MEIQEALANYRIISNGLKYRIQKRERHKFLWWTWSVWLTLEMFCGFFGDTCPWECDTLEEAQRERHRLAERDAKYHSWQTVEKETD